MVCLVSLGLSGCTSKYGEQTAIVKSYSDCYAPIQKLRNEEHRVAKQTAGGAVAGALVGGLIGGLAGGGRGAAVGAVSGAAVGGAGSYYFSVRQQSKNENIRMARYMQDIKGDISGLNIATASARMSIQCYEKKFETSLARYKAKTISREQFQDSYKEIKSGVDEAHRILGVIISSAQEQDAQYKQALDEEEKLHQMPAKAARGGSPPPAPIKRSSLNEVKRTQTSYQTSISNAQKTQKEAEDFNARMAENMV